MKRSGTVLVVWAIGCGSGGGAAGDAGFALPDGGADAAAEAPDSGPGADMGADAPCRPLARAAGPAFVADQVTTFVLAGLDFGGDVQGQIEDGNLLLGFELLDLDDAALQDDPEVVVAFAQLRDLDDDPEDNFGGSEELCIEPDSLLAEEDDAPATGLAGSLAAGALAAGPVDMVVPSLFVAGINTPEVPVHEAVIDATVEAGGAGLSEGQMRAQAWVSELAQLDVLGINLLTVIACGFSGFIDATAPNVDVDGDGLETIVCDGDKQIASCTDGDGTPLEGWDCTAALQDAYAFEIDFEAVPFTIGGVWDP